MACSQTIVYKGGGIGTVWPEFLAMAMLGTGLLALSLLLFDDPGTPMMLFGMTLAGGTVVLLMFVMKALLRQATALLDERLGSNRQDWTGGASDNVIRD